jgi:hypothetical protein
VPLRGLEDGLPPAALFELARVVPSTWGAAQQAWEERILDDLEADGTLAERLEAEKARAMMSWKRPLPPLDQELRAWLDFLRTWAHEGDGQGFLAERGMHPSDIVRLQQLWTERMQQDPELQREALTILTEEPRPPGPIRPEPAALDPQAGQPQAGRGGSSGASCAGLDGGRTA